MANGLTPGITLSDAIKNIIVPGTFGFVLGASGVSAFGIGLGAVACVAYWAYITGAVTA